MTATEPLRVRLRVAGAHDLVASVRLLRMGQLDPTFRLGVDEVALAVRTPDGPGSLRLLQRPGSLDAEAHGPGARWLLQRAPRFAGLDDAPPERITADDPRLVRRLLEEHPGLRLPVALDPFDLCVRFVLQQKVRFADATRAYRRLVGLAQEPAPGPLDLLLPPSPALLLSTPLVPVIGHDVGRQRAETLRRVARRGAHLTRATTADEVTELVRELPGVGPWTIGQMRGVGLGDADAVCPGDFHLPNLVAWALAGEERGTDGRMMELLEPYRPHRFRLVLLLYAGHVKVPRRGPRMGPTTAQRLGPGRGSRVPGGRWRR